MKKKIAMIYGGKSPEHNISLLSAKNVIANIDKSRYDLVLIPIDKNGVWHFNEGDLRLENPESAKDISLPEYNNEVLFNQSAGKASFFDRETGNHISDIDVIYPVLHGLNGEDGAIQGLAKLANVPIVGCGILGSAICMDKDVAKRLLRDAGIGVADFVTLRKGYDYSYEEIKSRLGNELFIKPANLGSSVGVSFVDNERDFNKAVEFGFGYDPKVLVEEKVIGREIECAVLGNEFPMASEIGEILPKGWYTFENKYVDSDGAGLAIPADLTVEAVEKAKKMALETYITLECKGLSRVDMFLKENGEIIVNEVNTIPGFTKISMYPSLWDYSGIPYTELITKLIQYAVDEFDRQNAIILKY